MKKLILSPLIMITAFSGVVQAETSDISLGYSVGKFKEVSSKAWHVEIEHRFDSVFFMKGDIVSAQAKSSEPVEKVEAYTAMAGIIIPYQYQSNFLLSGGATNLTYKGNDQVSSVNPFVDIAFETILAQKDMALEAGMRIQQDSNAPNQFEYRINLKKKLSEDTSVELGNIFTKDGGLPKISISKNF